MIFTVESIVPQLDLLKMAYPNMEILESNENSIRLHGTILVHRTVSDFTVRKSYNVDIVIPINSDDLPYVIDVGKQIDESYHHLYEDGRLCLETDTRIRIRFIDGFNLIDWMTEFVEPYFVYYEFFQLYGAFPLGERSHGFDGVLETYQDIFHTTTIYQAVSIMSYIEKSFYRGHHTCPCGSGEHIRKCHGEWITPFYNDPRLKQILISDFTRLKILYRK